MSKLKRHIVYAGDVFIPVKSVNQFFARNEKDIMETYKDMCIDLGFNVPLEPFLHDAYLDRYFMGAINLN